MRRLHIAVMGGYLEGERTAPARQRRLLVPVVEGDGLNFFDLSARLPPSVRLQCRVEAPSAAGAGATWFQLHLNLNSPHVRRWTAIWSGCG